MKKIILISSVLIAFSLTGCGHKSAETTPKTNSTPSSSTTAQYECPMKCFPADAQAGKCAKCGMDKKEVK
jgi:predicted nucleic acid binding AN1-type Zn finger protein